MSKVSRRVVLTTTSPVTAGAFLPYLVGPLARTHEVHVISSPGAELQELAAKFSIVTHDLPMSRSISPGKDLVAFIRWVVVIARIRPCLVLSMTPKASLLAMVAAKLVGVPRRTYLLVGLRLEGEHGRRRRVLAVMERTTAWAATTVVANSPSLREAAVALRLVPPDKIITTRPGSSHGVDAHHFSPARSNPHLAREVGLKPNVPVIGFMGRITHDKGLDTLLAASCRLAHRKVQHQVLIVGSHDEADSKSYVQRFRNAPVNAAIVEHAPDVRDYYALMDIHVLPTLREGFPNVVLEASSMQLPTVTTRATGAVDSVLHDVTGLLVDSGSPEGLSDAIELLILDPLKRIALGEAAREWVRKEFNPDRIVSTVLGEGRCDREE